jgi:hypothetical protein
MTRRDFISACEDETMDSILARLHRSHAAVAPVFRQSGVVPSSSEVTGIITWEDIERLLEETFELSSEGGK